MTLAEFNERASALKAEGLALARDGKLEEAEAKKAALESLTAQFESEKKALAEENALRDQTTVPEMIQAPNTNMGEENETMEKIFDASSIEYKNAFLKSVTGRADQMTELENAAYTHTTSTAGQVLPTTLVDEIWDLVSQNHVIMGDVTIYRTGTILEVVKHTEIAQGKAAKKGEGTANDDEKNTFVKVTLSGNDFVKTVKVSYAEAEMAIDAFEKYLVNEISRSIGEALADDVVSAIQTGINSANKLTATAATFGYANITAAFGALKRVADPVVYVTRATLYNRLATLADAAGHLIYQPSATAGVPGTLLGAQVKIEDSVADDVIMVGDSKRVVYNMIQDIMVETDKDIEAHKYIYSGYARGEGALIDDKSFAMITISAS